MKIKWTGFLLAFLWSNFSLAFAVVPAPFEILTPVISGSGCTDGSATATFSQDDRMVRLQFNNSIAEAGGAFGSFNRKNCSLVIPVQVNAGYSIALPVVELNGAVEIEKLATVSLDAEIFFAGGKGVLSKIDFFPLKQFQFIPTIDPNLWSPCGVAVNVRMNVNFLVKSPPGNASSHVKLLKGLVEFTKWKRCDL